MIRIASVLSALLLVVAACSKEAGATGANPAGIADQLVKALASVTDGKTAEQAKTQVTTLTDQLATALESVKGAATGGAGALGKAAGEIASKAAGDWLSPELKTSFGTISTEITRLLGNEEIKNVLGATLEKLKGLLPSAG
jgi:hypothetical protein